MAAEPGLATAGASNGGMRMLAIRIVVLTVCVLAVAYFVLRGPIRALDDSRDLTYGYAAAQAWFHGANPYDADVLAKNMIAGGGPVVAMAIGHGVYFPLSIPLFLPISFGPWSSAMMIGLVLNVVGALGIAFGLCRWVGLRARSLPGFAMIAAILALGPIHTTIAAGQTGVGSTAFIVAAMLLTQSGRASWSGAMYGLAAAVKMQVALPFIAFEALRRRWVSVAAAMTLIGGLSLVAIARMALADVSWFSSWTANLAWLTGPTGNGSADPSNPDRFSLINLEYPLRVLLPEPWAWFAAVLLVAVGTLATIVLVGGRSPKHELLALSLVAVLGLLVTYHRYYDAVLLALPIAWSFSALATPMRRHALAVLLLVSPFIVPLLGALREAEAGGHVPAWLARSPLWTGFILPHQAWSLVLIVAVLLSAAWQARGLDLEVPQVMPAGRLGTESPSPP